MKLYYIIYPTGSHGQFLKHLLNYMSGQKIDHLWFSDGVFDRPYKPDASGHCGNQSGHSSLHCLFETAHHYQQDMQANVINITVKPPSHLKYLMMVFTRHAMMRFTLKDWENQVWQIIHKNNILCGFAKDLQCIVKHHDIQQYHLREWCRLTFFHNQGQTIKTWISDSTVDTQYQFDFENFYSEQLATRCQDLLNHLDAPVINRDIQVWQQIFSRTPYRDVDWQLKKIKEAILAKKSIMIPDNFILQACLDHWLQCQYDVTVLVPSRYWGNTLDLMRDYGL